MHRSLEIFQVMLSKVSQAYPSPCSDGRNQIVRRLRKQNLTSVSRAHDACGEMNIQAHIAFGHPRWFTSMQPHSNTNRHTVRPLHRGKLELSGHRGGQRIAGTSKHGEEGIPLCINLAPSLLVEYAPEHRSGRSQQLAVPISKLLEELGGALDIGE
jgi:hypothetical protein